MSGFRRRGRSEGVVLLAVCSIALTAVIARAQERDTSGLTPLSELGSGKYKNESGGLYGKGKNEPPTEHQAAAQRESAKIQPLDKEGRPAANGKIALLSMGMSNTSQVSQGFQKLMREDREVSPRVVFVNGAQGGMDAARWADTKQTNPQTGKSVWDFVDDRLSQAGVTSQQVQVVWLKQALIQPSRLGEFPKHAERLRDDIAKSLAVAKERFPNLRIVYLSSRTYGGHAKSNLNPEPFAYESAFSVRWLIDSQIKGDADLNFDPARGAVKAPLLLWGPYLWANGDTPRKSDGLTWTTEDVASDGTHQSQSGQFKSGLQLLRFLKNDPLTRRWFVGANRETSQTSDDGPRRGSQIATRGNGLLDLNQLWSRGQAAGTGSVKFTHSPMRIADTERIVPYGLMVGGHVCPIDHQYYYPRPLPPSGEHFDVIAPADGHLVMIGHRVQLTGSTERQREYDDYQLQIEHSATFYTHYDLLTKLDSEILEQLDTSVRDRFARKQMGPAVHVRIPITAGQVLGKVGGRSLDFGALDTTVVLKGFLNPSMYGHYAWRVHAVDPFDYFNEPLRNQLLKLNPRQAEPRGGKIDLDVDGRLIGNWFREGTGGYSGTRDPRGYWMGHLAFAYHHIDPSQIIVSIGDFDGRPRQFAVIGNAPDPGKVSEASGLVKYELVMSPLGAYGQRFAGIDTRVAGVLLAEVMKDRRLRVEVFLGEAAADVTGFTEDSVVYER